MQRDPLSWGAALDHQWHPCFLWRHFLVASSRTVVVWLRPCCFHAPRLTCDPGHAFLHRWGKDDVFGSSPFALCHIWPCRHHSPGAQGIWRDDTDQAFDICHTGGYFVRERIWKYLCLSLTWGPSCQGKETWQMNLESEILSNQGKCTQIQYNICC